MRKLILSINISVDGFVEAVNKDMSWLQPDDKEQWKELFNMLKNVDLFLLGRGMWKEYRDYWTKALDEPGFSAEEIKYAKLAINTQHIIFSTTLKKSGWPNAKIMQGDLKEEVLKFKQQPGKSIQIVGGAKFAAALIDSGLIDEYRFSVNPAILAKGKSIFTGLKNRHSLQLTRVKQLRCGVTVLCLNQQTTVDASKVKPVKRRSLKK